MLEYTLFLRHGNATPYTLGTYKTISAAKEKLYDIVDLEVKRHRPFYVDNDFFKNNYELGYNSFYISILEREVEQWHKFSQAESQESNNNKLVYINNYKQQYV